MTNMTSWMKIVTVLCGVAALFACSNGNSNTPLVDSTGKHPANWLEQHWVVYNSTTPGAAKLVGKSVGEAATVSNSPCAECHGSDLLGGVSKVSCFSAQSQNGQQCHATTLGHPDGWDNALEHGKSGAMATPGISSGFAYCAKCHGSDYKGGTGKAVSCFSCHTTAPHPPKPWIGGTLSHTTTAPANAAVCFQCHANGNNFGPVIVSTPLSTSPPAPTPDCFNNTLCHGGNVNPPHAKSAAYLAASQHGIDAAGKNSTKPELSLATCKICHTGSTMRFNLTSNNMANGCETCHAENTAHPTPWLPARTGTATEVPAPNKPNNSTHATVPATNLTTACNLCHGAALDGVGGNGAPSCMSATAKFGISCHATSPVANPAGCTSCHSTFNIQKQPTTGAHGKHLNLPNVDCNSCHTGAGVDTNTNFGRALHANGFTNVTSATFWAKTGGLRLNADKTCANVRCHGGQATPGWTTAGTLTVATDCLKCHEQGTASGTPQFNSFFSGNFGTINLHDFHLNDTVLVRPNLGGVNAKCTDCHNIDFLTPQQHFGGLAATTFTAPEKTIGGGATRITNNYIVPARSCVTTCHNLFPAGTSLLWIQ